MQLFRSRTLLSLFSTIALLLLVNSSRAQETQRQKQEQNTQQNQYRDEAQATQLDQSMGNSQSYSGKVSQKYGKFYLEVAHSRSSYLLEDIWQGKRFVNKKVRVTGLLDSDKNILHVVSISIAP